MKIHHLLILGFFLLATPLKTWSHPGGLDIQGGHSDKESGRYHLHRDSGVSYRLPKPAPEATSIRGKVLRILTGDSFRIMNNDRVLIVELEGIDAPELDQPHGEAARRALERMIAGRVVQAKIVAQLEDTRVRAQVDLPSGSELATELLRLGHAWLAPGPERPESLREAEREARLKRRGLWALPSPLPPWQWRTRPPP